MTETKVLLIAGTLMLGVSLLAAGSLFLLTASPLLVILGGTLAGLAVYVATCSLSKPYITELSVEDDVAQEIPLAAFAPSQGESTMLRTITGPPANPEGRIPIHTRWFVVDSPATFGQSIGDLQIRKLTRCSVLAVCRDGVCVDYPDGQFELSEGDRLYVAGTNAELAFFERAFGMSSYVGADVLFDQRQVA